MQYYLDLPEVNKDPNKAAEWKVEYSFRSAYGVRDVSPARTRDNLIFIMVTLYIETTHYSPFQ